jgi:endoglucanase
MRQRHNILLALGTTLLFLLSPAFADPTFVERHGHLHVKGNQIVDQSGHALALHGMSLYCWGPQGAQYYNPSAIQHLAQDWKCTVIRIPILPRAYQRNPTNEINRVKTVMDACLANGIYAIVDWHSMRGAQNNIPSAQAFFATVATAYGHTPNILYETWNEPERESWPVIKAYHEAIIPVIRALDPANLIICGSRNWDQQIAEASRNPITISTNIAYSIHFYAATHHQFLRDNGTAALTNGVALFATEYGTSEASGTGRFDTVETRFWWNWLAANHLSCANWSMAALGETSAALVPGANATGPWPDDQLKPSGRLVRDYLISQYPAGP